MLSSKQLRNIRKAFKQASIKAQFYIKEVNEFGEEDREKFFIETDGIFYEETARVNLNITTNGTATTDTYQTLMILKDYETDLIDEHLICSIKGKRYRIIKIDNAGEMDVYYTLRLKRVESNED